MNTLITGTNKRNKNRSDNIEAMKQMFDRMAETPMPVPSGVPKPKQPIIRGVKTPVG